MDNTMELPNVAGDMTPDTIVDISMEQDVFAGSDSVPVAEAGVDIISIDSADGDREEVSASDESIEAELNDEEQLEKVREELEEESNTTEETESDYVSSIEEQIRQIDETIAMLSMELRELKEIRGLGIMAALKKMFAYFVAETFFENSTEKQNSEERDYSYLDSKIDLLERDISRLKDVKAKLASMLPNTTSQVSLEMPVA